MKISELTYEQVRRDFDLPPICTGLLDSGKPCGWSANWHYHGIVSGGRMHWSRTGMRRAGLHAFLRASLQHYMNWWAIYAASVTADITIRDRYGIRIPASASKWERRTVLATTRHIGINLRTDHPRVYAWATYKGAK